MLGEDWEFVSVPGEKEVNTKGNRERENEGKLLQGVKRLVMAGLGGP